MEYLNPAEMPTAEQWKAFFDELLDSVKHLAQNLSFLDKHILLLYAIEAAIAASLLTVNARNNPEMRDAIAMLLFGEGMWALTFITTLAHLKLRK